MMFVGFSAATVGAAVGGCTAPQEPPSLTANDPYAQNKAVAQAIRTKDRAAVPDLIAMLDSEDPAERMMGIAGLKRITGQDFGYDPTDPEWQRTQAADRWQAWWESGAADPKASAAASQPSAPRGSER